MNNLSEIVRVDKKGSITIPESIRDGIGIVEGMHVMMKADVDKRELIITPFTTAEVDLVEFFITLSDKPGSLGKCATYLGEHKINFVASEAKAEPREGIAKWNVVTDISNCKANVREICQELVSKGYAKDAVCRSFH